RFMIEVGMLMFGVATILVLVYAIVRLRDPSRRTIVILIALPDLLLIAFSINHWPFANLIVLLMMTPVVVYTIGVLKNVKDYRNEIAFLTIIAVMAAGT